MYEANLVGLDIHAEVSSVPVRYKYCIWESLVKCILYCFVTTFCMCFEKRRSLCLPYPQPMQDSRNVYTRLICASYWRLAYL